MSTPFPLMGKAIRKVVRVAALRTAITVLALRGRGRVPDRRVLRWLRFGWANQDGPASPEYMQEMARQAIATPGSIVEAGSGLTSIVMSYVARPDQPIVSLEHLPEWAERVSRHTSRRSAHRVLLRPLTSHDGYDWYAVSEGDLPGDVTLAIVDGPPGTTRGGRYGALPQLAPRLSPAAVLLLDDASRPDEQRVLAQWAREFATRADVRGAGPNAFAVVRLPNP